MSAHGNYMIIRLTTGTVHKNNKLYIFNMTGNCLGHSEKLAASQLRLPYRSTRIRNSEKIKTNTHSRSSVSCSPQR